MHYDEPVVGAPPHIGDPQSPICTPEELLPPAASDRASKDNDQIPILDIQSGRFYLAEDGDISNWTRQDTQACGTWFYDRGPSALPYACIEVRVIDEWLGKSPCHGRILIL
jgi:hypothetical protein